MCVDCEQHIPVDEHGEVDNVLFLHMEGGYGLFVEVDEFMSPTFRRNNPLALCHDCAHKLCDTLPWLNNIIEPHTSHTHKAGKEH